MNKGLQYQLEEIYDWTSYLIYLQFILLKFDVATASMELIIVRYFEEGLKLSIQFKIDQDDYQLDDFK